jgi:hypothetical protein
MTKRNTIATEKAGATNLSREYALLFSQESAAEMFATADISKVCGKHFIHGEKIIIPAAEVLRMGASAQGAVPGRPHQVTMRIPAIAMAGVGVARLQQRSFA